MPAGIRVPFCCHSAEARLHLFRHTCIHSPITVLIQPCLRARFLFRPPASPISTRFVADPDKNRPSCRFQLRACFPCPTVIDPESLGHKLPTSAPDPRPAFCRRPGEPTCLPSLTRSFCLRLLGPWVSRLAACLHSLRPSLCTAASSQSASFLLNKVLFFTQLVLHVGPFQTRESLLLF